MNRTEQKFYICKHCGNIVGSIKDGGAPLVCCGEKMHLMVPNTTDAATEKHVPVVKIDGNKVVVEVGTAPHPMTEEHHISWVYLETQKGGQRKNLTPADAPTATFLISDDDVLENTFAYCNLHGLWKA